MTVLADVLFLAGLATVVIGGWLHGISSGIICTGLAICLGAVVANRALQRRRNKR